MSLNKRYDKRLTELERRNLPLTILLWKPIDRGDVYPPKPQIDPKKNEILIKVEYYEKKNVAVDLVGGSNDTK